MRTVKAICTATILVVALSLPALAGDISTPGVSTPEPTPSPELDGTALRGDISTPGFMDVVFSIISAV